MAHRTQGFRLVRVVFPHIAKPRLRKGPTEGKAGRKLGLCPGWWPAPTLRPGHRGYRVLATLTSSPHVEGPGLDELTTHSCIKRKKGTFWVTKGPFSPPTQGHQ